MLKWFQTIKFAHPVSISLSLSCILSGVLFGSIVMSNSSSAAIGILSGVVFSTIVCLSTKWLIRKE